MSTRTCPECKGRKTVEEWKRDADGNRYPAQVTCPRCGGSGEVEA